MWCKRAALRFSDYGEMSWLHFIGTELENTKEERARCIFKVIFVPFHHFFAVLSFGWDVDVDEERRLHIIGNVPKDSFYSILKHLNRPIQPSEHTPVLLVHTQVISGHLYFNDRSVSGKTYIRRSLERVIRGLSKINEPQFLCHFSPQNHLTRIWREFSPPKPFDKVEEFENDNFKRWTEWPHKIRSKSPWKVTNWLKGEAHWRG